MNPNFELYSKLSKSFILRHNHHQLPTMARQRKEKSVKDIKLQQPDRSGPSKETLVDFAKGRDLFAEADRRQRELNGEGPLLSPRTERIFETILWTGVIATVHFTFDVLVQRQYAMDVDWFAIVQRTLTAWLCKISPIYTNFPPNMMFL